MSSEIFSPAVEQKKHAVHPQAEGRTCELLDVIGHPGVGGSTEIRGSTPCKAIKACLVISGFLQGLSLLASAFAVSARLSEHSEMVADVLKPRLAALIFCAVVEKRRNGEIFVATVFENGRCYRQQMSDIWR